MTNINNNNLPVLYTIPRWKLVRKLISKSGGKSTLIYFIPELNKWIRANFMNLELSRISSNLQIYYDRWILNITTPSQRPRCEYPGCTNEARFFNIVLGYSKGSCNDPIHKKAIANRHKARESTPEKSRKVSESLREFHKNNPDVGKKMGKSISRTYDLHPEKRNIQRLNGLKRYQDPKEIERSSNIMIELHKKGIFKDSSRGHGTKSSAYSEWQEKTVYFDSTWEDEFFHKCEVISKVTYLSRSPFIIRYVSPRDNKVHSYTPDFLLNDRYLIEIKPNYLIHDPVNQAKFHAASIYCSDHNLSYVIITEDYLFHNGSPYYGSLPFKLNDHATTDY